MDKKRKHIDDFFRDKLGSYAEVPPSDAWNDMDKKLDTLVPHPVTHPYRWLGHVGIVSLIAVLGVSVFNKFSHETNSDTKIANNTQIVNKIESFTETKIPDIVAIEPQQAALPSLGNNQGNQPAFTHAVRSSYPETLGYGESYSENADNEYIEGITEIKKEIISTTESNHAGYLADAHTNSRNGNVTYNNHFNASPAFAGAVNNNYTFGEADKNTENQYFSNISEKDKNNNLAPADASKNALTPALKAENNIIPKQSAASFARWDAGIKAGYERGFNTAAANSFAVSSYVAYNISRRAGIMLQPTVKLANAPVRTVGDAASYYKVNDDAAVTTVENYTTTEVEGTSVVYYNNTKFRYTQSHDSIVKTNRTGGRYVQYELPILFNYKCNDKLSVYAGVNVVYSRLQSVTEHTYTKTGIVRIADTLIKSTSTPVAPATTDIITYTGTPVSQYSGPIYPAGHESNLRMGAMAGVSYEYSSRWLVDAMVQKTPAPAAVKGGYNINAPLSAPTFRISVGYKLKK